MGCMGRHAASFMHRQMLHQCRLWSGSFPCVVLSYSEAWLTAWLIDVGLSGIPRAVAMSHPLPSVGGIGDNANMRGLRC